MFVCVVLDRHLVCLVLAAPWLYVKWGTWRARCKRGVALVKFQTVPISCGVTGHICTDPRQS